VRVYKTVAQKREVQRKWWGGARRVHARSLWRYHGPTLAEYDAMVAGQHGCCLICGQPETVVGKSGELLPLAVDHNHETGEIRGLLCHKCNRGLGAFRDSAELLRAAADYLDHRDVTLCETHSGTEC
jgi:hypothetical protein